MSEKTEEVSQLADATYAHTLVIKKYSWISIFIESHANFKYTMYLEIYWLFKNIFYDTQFKHDLECQVRVESCLKAELLYYITM